MLIKWTVIYKITTCLIWSLFSGDMFLFFLKILIIIWWEYLYLGALFPFKEKKNPTPVPIIAGLKIHAASVFSIISTNGPFYSLYIKISVVAFPPLSMSS